LRESQLLSSFYNVSGEIVCVNGCLRSVKLIQTSGGFRESLTHRTEAQLRDCLKTLPGSGRPGPEGFSDFWGNEYR
jgi:hypothetical protein